MTMLSASRALFRSTPIACFTAALGFASAANAVTVAVVDSGTDLSHAAFAGKVWTNPGETVNFLDDDRNGKIDDIHGWNFLDQYGQVFFPEHLSAFPDEVYRFSEVMARIELNVLTDEDKTFWNTVISGTSDKQKKVLIQGITNFGNFIHGTHTAGIVASQSPGPDSQLRVMSLRTIPDQFYPKVDVIAEALAGSTRGIDDLIYKVVAEQLNTNFFAISDYFNEHRVEVANFSLGTPLSMLARMVLSLTGKKDPTEEQLIKVVDKMYAQLAPSGEAWMRNAPNTLIVIASGNEGLNNDKLKAYPAGLDFDNTITVGASHGTEGIAFFSNYGAKSVHVLAPGSAVLSAVPHASGTKELPFSGTSMAAPFVAGLAANLMELNPKLSPLDLKRLIMGTVDVKPELAEKVVISGIVNGDRARAAAKHTLTTSIEDAITLAQGQVADQPELPPEFIKTGKLPAQDGTRIDATKEMLEFVGSCCRL